MPKIEADACFVCWSERKVYTKATFEWDNCKWCTSCLEADNDGKIPEDAMPIEDEDTRSPGHHNCSQCGKRLHGRACAIGTCKECRTKKPGQEPEVKEPQAPGYAGDPDNGMVPHELSRVEKLTELTKQVQANVREVFGEPTTEEYAEGRVLKTGDTITIASADSTDLSSKDVGTAPYAWRKAKRHQFRTQSAKVNEPPEFKALAARLPELLSESDDIVLLRPPKHLTAKSFRDWARKHLQSVGYRVEVSQNAKENLVVISRKFSKDGEVLPLVEEKRFTVTDIVTAPVTTA